MAATRRNTNLTTLDWSPSAGFDEIRAFTLETRFCSRNALTQRNQRSPPESTILYLGQSTPARLLNATARKSTCKLAESVDRRRRNANNSLWNRIDAMQSTRLSRLFDQQFNSINEKKSAQRNNDEIRVLFSPEIAIPSQLATRITCCKTGFMTCD